MVRSVKIGVMEVGEELARRGHEVTVISPHKYKEVPPGVREIVHQSGFEALTTATTEDMLSNENAGLPFVKVEGLFVTVQQNNYDYRLSMLVLMEREVPCCILMSSPSSRKRRCMLSSLCQCLPMRSAATLLTRRTPLLSLS